MNSMTGFARAEGSDDTASWFWEARSVNGKGLDVRLRMPPGFDELEALVRAKVAKSFKRGNLSLNLNLQRHSGPVEIRVNNDALDQVVAASELIGARLGRNAQASLDAIIAIKGVLEVAEVEEAADVREARRAAILATSETCLSALAAARQSEGAQLAKALSDQLKEISSLTETITASKARAPEAIAARLKANIYNLVRDDNGLDPARLYQEAVLLATRADVAEELTRLRAHILAAHDLMADSAAVGRRFDFLAQEFNREANTICSKSNDAEVSQAGMALKVVIDQLREQVQNVE